MPTCQKCGKDFPNWIKLNGERKNISKRKYCLDCSPFGMHNTRKIEKPRASAKKAMLNLLKELDGEIDKCILCCEKCQAVFIER